MIKLSRMADYAVVVTSAMTRDDRPLMCAQDLADSTGLSAPTVSKILKLLVKANIVRSERGAHGGYGLAEVPKNIPILHIIEAIDGSVALTDCADHGKTGSCSIESVCNTRPHWHKLNGIIRNALLSATLDEFAAPTAAYDFINGQQANTQNQLQEQRHA